MDLNHRCTLQLSRCLFDACLVCFHVVRNVLVCGEFVANSYAETTLLVVLYQVTASDIWVPASPAQQYTVDENSLELTGWLPSVLARHQM